MSPTQETTLHLYCRLHRDRRQQRKLSHHDHVKWDNIRVLAGVGWVRARARSDLRRKDAHRKCNGSARGEFSCVSVSGRSPPLPPWPGHLNSDLSHIDRRVAFTNVSIYLSRGTSCRRTAKDSHFTIPSYVQRQLCKQHNHSSRPINHSSIER